MMEVKELCNENYKTLKKEIEKEENKKLKKALEDGKTFHVHGSAELIL
jgi:ribosomal protein L7/L12